MGRKWRSPGATREMENGPLLHGVSKGRAKGTFSPPDRCVLGSRETGWVVRTTWENFGHFADNRAAGMSL